MPAKVGRREETKRAERGTSAELKKQTEKEELLHLCVDKHIRFIPREGSYPASGYAKKPDV